MLYERLSLERIPGDLLPTLYLNPLSGATPGRSGVGRVSFSAAYVSALPFGVY